MFDKSIKDTFYQVSGRDRKASEYYASEEFLQECRERLERDLIRDGGVTADLSPRGVEPQKGDLAYIEMAVSKLKKEYPELDKVKIDSYGDIVFETKSLEGTGQISARDKRAADYLSSQEFLEECRERLRRDLVEDGDLLADLSPRKMYLRQQDMPHIEKVFSQLKKEYPELNHPMIDSYGHVCFDTREKPKNFFQKIKRAFSQSL